MDTVNDSLFTLVHLNLGSQPLGVRQKPLGQREEKKKKSRHPTHVLRPPPTPPQGLLLSTCEYGEAPQNMDVPTPTRLVCNTYLWNVV
ncbi:hypothetical protein NPIL_413161 [Nephila pilipes]|uniref:Uncharacterized protein n=1 Tax=Nephila pilipes TaxID=299642 RepID=A0A8X6NJT7_NEPPI|nr:hypothetical protein NPIL_413161 [Nephila pilipes]